MSIKTHNIEEKKMRSANIIALMITCDDQWIMFVRFSGLFFDKFKKNRNLKLLMECQNLSTIMLNKVLGHCMSLIDLRQQLVTMFFDIKIYNKKKIQFLILGTKSNFSPQTVLQYCKPLCFYVWNAQK